MSKGTGWALLSFTIIIAFALTGLFLAVTPAAASGTQTTSFNYGMNPATTLHSTVVEPADTTLASPLASQPSADGCLLCYSPFHSLLTRLSGWVGK